MHAVRARVADRAYAAAGRLAALQIGFAVWRKRTDPRVHWTSWTGALIFDSPASQNPAIPEMPENGNLQVFPFPFFPAPPIWGRGTGNLAGA